jgi:cell fate regulator YaaT (PSP1 superfamily)
LNRLAISDSGLLFPLSVLPFIQQIIYFCQHNKKQIMGNNGFISRGCTHIASDAADSHFCKCGSCSKLEVYDWLNDIPTGMLPSDIVEVRFKNTRKGYYRNVNGLTLKQGDIIAVEASPGHDIGIVALSGELVSQQIKRFKVRTENGDFKKVYRKAKSVDIEKWKEALDLEDATMLKARKISDNLKLNMKIGDVEYQGDKTKAIFYYIAEERVDFRELIKVLAEEFKVRIEMRQIGARQEAGRIGGIGSCGRELCCTTWMTSFVSVSTNAARYQEVSLNPQKLAGQCSKLKCCLNYELDAYLDTQKDFPDINVPLEAFDGTMYHQKTDVFRRMMWYSYSRDEGANFIPLPVEKVKEILIANKKGIKPKVEVEEEKDAKKIASQELDFKNVVGQESITRFDQQKNKRRNNRFKKPNKPNENK